MAKVAGVSAATVQRVWYDRGLKPRLVANFKLFNDMLPEEELADVMGLYMAPPDKRGPMHGREVPDPSAGRRPAVTADESGDAGTMTHDCKRNGTTTCSPL